LSIYMLVDQFLISIAFGTEFADALVPTRLLLIIALVDSISQLLVQPLLASGLTARYAAWQNGVALLSACIGWIWIPYYGLAGYLSVKAIYSLIPATAFFYMVIKHISNPLHIFIYGMVTLVAVGLTLLQLFGFISPGVTWPFAALTALLLFCEVRSLASFRMVLNKQ